MVFTPKRVPEPLTGVGGWLAFFIFGLVILGPFFAFTDIGYAAKFLRALIDRTVRPAEGVATLAAWLTYLGVRIYGVYAGVELWRVRPNAVSEAKRFLLMYATTTAVIVLVRFTWATLNGHAVQNRLDLMMELFRALAYSAVWYAYLVRSVRVENTYSEMNVNAIDRGITT
jgi:hypothetical protein